MPSSNSLAFSAFQPPYSHPLHVNFLAGNSYFSNLDALGVVLNIPECTAFLHLAYFEALQMVA